MLRWFFRSRLDAEEKKLGVSMDYLRHVLEVSPSAFLRFASIMPFANSRKALPATAWYVAQLTALKHEDCGPCLQIGVNLARKQGIDATLVRKVLAGDVEEITAELADVSRFTEAVLQQSGEAEILRDELRQHYGERGLVEIAFAIASSRIPPTVKRVLGYARSCSEVKVEL